MFRSIHSFTFGEMMPSSMLAALAPVHSMALPCFTCLRLRIHVFRSIKMLRRIVCPHFAAYAWMPMAAYPVYTTVHPWWAWRTRHESRVQNATTKLYKYEDITYSDATPSVCVVFHVRFTAKLCPCSVFWCSRPIHRYTASHIQHPILGPLHTIEYGHVCAGTIRHALVSHNQ